MKKNLLRWFLVVVTTLFVGITALTLGRWSLVPLLVLVDGGHDRSAAFLLAVPWAFLVHGALRWFWENWRRRDPQRPLHQEDW